MGSIWAVIKGFFSANIASLLEILGIAAAAIGSIAYVRKTGVDAQQNADMKADLKGVEVRNDIEQKTTAAGDAANLTELHEWDRKL